MYIVNTKVRYDNEKAASHSIPTEELESIKSDIKGPAHKYFVI